MSNSLSNLDYLKYIEPHLVFKIVEFLIKQNVTDEVKSLYKNLSITIKNFETIQKEKFMFESELNELRSKNESEIKELEENLQGFIKLSENCGKQKTYDLNFFSLGKKTIELTFPIDVLQYST